MQALVDKEKVVVFMKGVPEAPQCGFSNAVCITPPTQYNSFSNAVCIRPPDIIPLAMLYVSDHLNIIPIT